jgi:F-type H+-transporting ATPase subunit epsilon
MPTTFQLSVVSPDKTVVDEATDSVIVPGVEGYFGVQAGHEPFVTQLRTGVVSYKDAAGQDQTVAVSGGFVEASSDHVIVIADSAERSGDIDRARALEALERAKERLSNRTSDVSLERAQASLERSTNRIKVADG